MAASEIASLRERIAELEGRHAKEIADVTGDLTCPVCKDVMEPLMVCPNMHCLCVKCYNKMNAPGRSPFCPVCRVSMISDATIIDRRIVQRAAELMITFKCSCAGCALVLPYQEIMAHRKVCAHRDISCPFCSSCVSAGGMVNHLTHVHDAKPCNAPVLLSSQGPFLGLLMKGGNAVAVVKLSSDTSSLCVHAYSLTPEPQTIRVLVGTHETGIHIMRIARPMMNPVVAAPLVSIHKFVCESLLGGGGDPLSFSMTFTLVVPE